MSVFHTSSNRHCSGRKKKMIFSKKKKSDTQKLRLRLALLSLRAHAFMRAVAVAATRGLVLVCVYACVCVCVCVCVRMLLVYVSSYSCYMCPHNTAISVLIILLYVCSYSCNTPATRLQHACNTPAKRIHTLLRPRARAPRTACGAGQCSPTSPYSSGSERRSRACTCPPLPRAIACVCCALGTRELASRSASSASPPLPARRYEEYAHTRIVV